MYPWYDNGLRHSKRCCRRLEHKWLRTRQESDLLEFKQLRNKHANNVDTAKCNFISGELEKCGNDTKKIYDIVNTVLGRSKNNPLPEGDNQSLAEQFADYFLQKITDIRQELDQSPIYQVSNDYNGEQLSMFKEVDEETVIKLITNSKSATCNLDAYTPH